MNFSSGDFGDETVRVGFKTVDFPGSSPFATSIGGTSLALDSSNNIAFQTGWGNNITIAYNTPSAHPLAGMPFNEGFTGGACGGTSIYFARPPWQTTVGTMRQIPDISMDASCASAAAVYGNNGGYPAQPSSWSAACGTSLAAPMLAGIVALMWVIEIVMSSSERSHTQIWSRC